MPPRERAALRARIDARAPGRLRVAVVRPRSLGGGTIAAYANAIDADLGAKGALLVVAGAARYVVTSHPNDDEAAAAVREAVQTTEGEPLAAELLAAVEELAAADPGPEADLDEGGDVVGPLIAVDTDGIARAILTIAAIVLGSAGLLVGTVVVAARRRRRTEQRAALATARKELGALGEEIAALDLDASMPGADPTACEEYHAGVAAYQAAEERIGEGEPDLAAVRAASGEIAAGRARLAVARERFDAGRP